MPPMTPTTESAKTINDAELRAMIVEMRKPGFASQLDCTVWAGRLEQWLDDRTRSESAPMSLLNPNERQPDAPIPDHICSKTPDCPGCVQQRKSVQPGAGVGDRPFAWVREAPREWHFPHGAKKEGFIEVVHDADLSKPPSDEDGWMPLYLHPTPSSSAERAPVAGFAEGIKAAVDWVQARRFAWESENGYIEPDTNAMSFGTGPRSHAKEEYDCELVEIEEGIRAIATPPDAGTAAPVVVTDEMVKAAQLKLWSLQGGQPVTDPRDMRAALEATLLTSRAPGGTSDVSTPRTTDCEAICSGRVTVLARDAVTGAPIMTTIRI